MVLSFGRDHGTSPKGSNIISSCLMSCALNWTVGTLYINSAKDAIKGSTQVIYLKDGKSLRSSLISSRIDSSPVVDWNEAAMVESMKTMVMQGRNANMV